MSYPRSYEYSIRQGNIHIVVVRLHPSTRMELRIHRSELIGSIERILIFQNKQNKDHEQRYDFKATRDFYNLVTGSSYPYVVVDANGSKHVSDPDDVGKAHIVSAIFRICDSKEFEDQKISASDVLAIASVTDF